MNIFLPPLRPPGALAESRFRRACIRCGKCVEVCPHNAARLAGGFGPDRLLPIIEPAVAPCQLCMKCPPVCPTSALARECVRMEDVKMGRAYILTSRCLNYTGGAMCWTCYDRCPLRGKSIVLKDGFTPAITDACVGCGVCEHVCPSHAVTVIAEAANYKPLDAAPEMKQP